MAANQADVAAYKGTAAFMDRLLLTEARAMVVREYLVENFGFDDSQLKTLGMGKQAGANADADWGSIQILIFPAGTVIPADKTGASS